LPSTKPFGATAAASVRHLLTTVAHRSHVPTRAASLQRGIAVAVVARALKVSWDTVMRAVLDEARDRFAADGIYTVQTRECLALGVDEKAMNRVSRGRRREFVTVLVDLARGVPTDIVKGRSGAVLRDWLAKQPPQWRAGVKVATLDLAAPYRAELTDPDAGLPNARRSCSTGFTPRSSPARSLTTCLA